MVRKHKRAALAARAILLASAAFAMMGAANVPAPEAGPTVAVAPASMWTVANATTLVKLIERSRDEGLRPGDYGLAALRRAIAAGPGLELDGVAQASALALAHDYLLGRVTDRESMDWHIARPDNGSSLPMLLHAALERGRLEGFLQGLLPSNPRYLALKAALAEAGDTAERNRIRANMERWRWMPRGMGDDYIFVNVPSYHLQLVNDGQVTSTYTVVVGAPDTPTPQLASAAPSLVVNPWWNVPQSIIRKSNMRPGRPGFVFARANGGMTVRQPPGPRNALGKLKINLINDQAIYLHDTNAKSGFSRDERALSHGCIRVKDIDQLAAELMRDGGDESRLDAALAGSRTETLPLPKSWNVYLVYFTMDQDESGALVRYGDPYHRDAALLARLDGSNAGPAMQIASN